MEKRTHCGRSRHKLQRDRDMRVVTNGMVNSDRGGPQDSDLDEQTNVPDRSNEAIYTNLAIKLAPSYGKQVMPDTKATAKESYNTLLSIAAMPNQQQMPGTMPAGAGNKAWRDYDSPFLRRPVDPVLAGGDGPLEFY